MSVAKPASSLLRAALCAALLSACLPALAAGAAGNGSEPEKSSLSVELQPYKEVRVKKGGGWAVQKLSADEAKPGDVLIYRVLYRNEGPAPVKSAVLTQPVPQGAVLVFGTLTQSAAEATYSTDGGETFQRPPLKQRLANEDGSRLVKLATPEMITHIRWTFRKPVAPGAKGELRFKVRLK